MKKKIAIKMMAVLVATTLLLAGCGKTKSVEEQVAQNLMAETVPETESEKSVDDGLVDDSQTEAAANQASTSKVQLDQTEVDVPDATVSTADGSANSETNAKDDEEQIQIVILGDSIFDNNRSETGIACQLGVICNADIYNLAIGGTRASIDVGDNEDLSQWSVPNFTGMVNAMIGEVDPSIMNGTRAGEIFKECDFSKTDYFIVEYGTNDFLHTSPIAIEGARSDDQHSYAGAMTYGLYLLKKSFPNAHIIVMTPGYEQFWSGQNWVGDANSLNNGYGTLSDYINSCVYVCGQVGIETVINSYDVMSIDAYTASEDLEDGIHPSLSGRNKIAGYLGHIINKEEGLDDTEWSWEDWPGYNY